MRRRALESIVVMLAAQIAANPRYTILANQGVVPAGHVLPNSAVIGALLSTIQKSKRTVRVRMDLDKKTDYDKFKSRLLELLKKYEVLDAEGSSVEIVDVTVTTYQVVIAVRAKSNSDEPIKTLLIRDGMRVQEELSRARRHDALLTLATAKTIHQSQSGMSGDHGQPSLVNSKKQYDAFRYIVRG